jgi:hypothetical protein
VVKAHVSGRSSGRHTCKKRPDRIILRARVDTPIVETALGLRALDDRQIGLFKKGEQFGRPAMDKLRSQLHHRASRFTGE